MKFLTAYGRLKVYLHNAFWMIGDRLAGIGVSFLVTVLVARYLGPEEFGLLSYVVSLVALFTVAGHMGLSGLVVRELVDKPAARGVTLGTSLGLKSLGMLLGYGALAVYALVFEGVGSPAFPLVLLAGLALLLNPVEILEFWFQAFLKARYAAFARLGSLLVGAGLKLLILFLGGAVAFLVLANVLQALAFGLLLWLFYIKSSDLSLRAWRFDRARGRELFRQGWMIYLGSIFAVVYLKIDQVMLKLLAGSEAVGVYAVAAQLSEAWYFVPVAIVTSIFPKLLELRKESELNFQFRFQQLLDGLFTLGLLVALALSMLSAPLVALFFGPSYADSAPILAIHSWASVFIAMRAAFSKWILIEGALAFSLLTQGAGAAMNIVLNYALIPSYGPQGAAYATLFSYAAASFFSLAAYPKTRPVFFMMCRATLSMFRYAPALLRR